MKRVIAGLVALGLLAACGDDGSSDGDGTTTRSIETTTTTLDFGDLPLEVPEGFDPIPLPSLGFGLAVPTGWQATLLTEDALARLEGLREVDPAFVDAADAAASVGAVLYAAVVDEQTRVTDLKVDVQEVDDTDEAMLELSAEAASNPDLVDVEISGDPDAAPPRVRIRYRIPGPGGDEGPAQAEGTQYLFAGDGQVWSLIVTSEDPLAHDDVADRIADTFVLSPS